MIFVHTTVADDRGGQRNNEVTVGISKLPPLNTF